MPKLIEDRLSSLLADWIDTNRLEDYPDSVVLLVHVARRDEIRTRPCVVLNPSEGSQPETGDPPLGEQLVALREQWTGVNRLHLENSYLS